MPIRAKIELAPSSRGIPKEIARKLGRLASKMADPMPANRRVSIWLSRWVNENFRTSGGKVGGWAPFKARSEAGIPGRRKRGGGIDTSARLLLDTGRLRASVNPFYTRRLAGIGSALPYARAHDLGRPEKGLPARRILPVDTDTEVHNAALKIYETYVNAEVNRVKV